MTGLIVSLLSEPHYNKTDFLFIAHTKPTTLLYRIHYYAWWKPNATLTRVLDRAIA